MIRWFITMEMSDALTNIGQQNVKGTNDWFFQRISATGILCVQSLGKHPALEEDVTIAIGRYGPYVKCKKILASLPKVMSNHLLPQFAM